MNSLAFAHKRDSISFRQDREEINVTTPFTGSQHCILRSSHTVGPVGMALHTSEVWTHTASLRQRDSCVPWKAFYDTGRDPVA